MTRRSMIAALLLVAAAAAGFAPVAGADHVYVGIGIGLPGFAVVAQGPVAIAPPPYFSGAVAYGRALMGGPAYGYRYCGRPYARYAPRVYARGYGGRAHYHY